LRRVARFTVEIEMGEHVVGDRPFDSGKLDVRGCRTGGGERGGRDEPRTPLGQGHAPEGSAL
jgi:hypothetical protein